MGSFGRLLCFQNYILTSYDRPVAQIKKMNQIINVLVMTVVMVYSMTLYDNGEPRLHFLLDDTLNRR